MFKFNRLVCVLLVGSVVAIAYGKAVKVTELTPLAPESADADGMVILNYNVGQDRTEVQVAITGFEAYADYTVLVKAMGEVTLPITTNGAGNGSGHKTGIGDMTSDDSGNTACVSVEVRKVGADGLRASGTSCPQP